MKLEDYIGEATSYDKKLMLERKDPTSWLKSVSAFANTQGGKLLFGVANDGALCGLADAQDDSEFISETINAKVPGMKIIKDCLPENLPDNLPENLPVTLTATAKRVYQKMKQQSDCTYNSLASAIGVTRETIRVSIASLVKHGLIRRVGPDKGGHWEVISKA